MPSTLRTALKHIPGLRPLVKRGRYWRWRLQNRLQTHHLAGVLDANRTLSVDPARIRDISVRDEIDTYAERGQIVGGDWDRNRKPFAELDAYQAFTAHFNDGVAWAQTAFYRRLLGEIEQGRIRWDCSSQEELDRRFLWLEQLYADIRDHGYKSQPELDAGADDPLAVEDEVVVAITRDGEFLFVDGRHRLSIAKLLDLPRIPVKVTRRHADWFRFRQEILNYAREHNGNIYHPLTHPDLSDIPAFHEEERFDMLAAHLSLSAGSLLDIGAHWGYFCHRFEAIGFDCTAVENDPVNLYFLRKLKQAEQRRFTIIDRSIFDLSEGGDYDVVLALNIFHHFLKTEAVYGQLIDLLGRLHTRIMFFQAHHPEGAQMRGAYRNYAADEFVAFILEHSHLSTAEYLGKARDGRPIYKLCA